MAFSYQGQQRRSRTSGPQHTTLNYWLPLGLTIATATVGFAAWIRNERNNRDGDDGEDTENVERRKEAGQDLQGAPNRTPQILTRAGAPDYRDERAVEQDSFVTRMSGAVRRTPSPQQMFDGASRRVVAGVAAAGAIVGRGLTAIRETDVDFQDHQRWSAETDIQNETDAVSGIAERDGRSSYRAIPTQSDGKRKTIAIVVSAEAGSSVWQDSGQAYKVEHASILSHLPRDISHETIDLTVLIYAPHLKGYPQHSPALLLSNQRTGSSSASSYSNISTPAADDETVLEVDVGQANASNELYESLQMSALQTVSHRTQVLPFTTPTGHIHLLRHLCPSLVYIDESLSGRDGGHVREIQSWVGQIVIVIGGEGLADTETEDESGVDATDNGWWKDSNRIGLGKAEIVESSRVTEDWMKRIG